MLHTVKGDLLTSDCTIIAHQANCYGIFESALAQRIKQEIPCAYKVDKQLTKPPIERLGTATYAVTDEGSIIFNLYGQYAYGRGYLYTDYIALEKALRSMLGVLDSLRYPLDVKIGIPHHLGCDDSGGDWTVVRKIVEDVFVKHNRMVYIYK